MQHQHPRPPAPPRPGCSVSTPPEEARRAIAEVREFLAERINNHLCVILLLAESGSCGGDPDRISSIRRAAGEIQELLDTLSPCALERWRAHYSHVGAPGRAGVPAPVREWHESG